MTPLARTIKCANYYRRLGLCPLPSRSDDKRPSLLSYAEHYEGVPVPESVYESWYSTNIQLMCGTKTPTPQKIMVVDCDGPEAIETWDRICSTNNYDTSHCWTVVTGSGGYHFYFSLTDRHNGGVGGDIPECPSGLLWGLWDTLGETGKGGWVKHKEIRLLGDKCLATAPPSVHVKTGEPYRFHDWHNPNRLNLPTSAPKWLLDMPRLATRLDSSLRRSHFIPATIAFPRQPRPPTPSKPYTRDEVLHAIGDEKFSIATKEWGLVAVTNHPNPAGWVRCFVPGREDPRHSKPSGSFHWRDGTLQDRSTMETMTFFDLGVACGRFPNWIDCKNSLANRFIDSFYRHDGNFL